MYFIPDKQQLALRLEIRLHLDSACVGLFTHFLDGNLAVVYLLHKTHVVFSMFRCHT